MVSRNRDAPEGGFDAIIQAAVCKVERQTARAHMFPHLTDITWDLVWHSFTPPSRTSKLRNIQRLGGKIKLIRRRLKRTEKFFIVYFPPFLLPGLMGTRSRSAGVQMLPTFWSSPQTQRLTWLWMVVWLESCSPTMDDATWTLIICTASLRPWLAHIKAEYLCAQTAMKGNHGSGMC